jgi:hypothetical protein
MIYLWATYVVCRYLYRPLSLTGRHTVALTEPGPLSHELLPVLLEDFSLNDLQVAMLSFAGQP